MKLPEQIKKPFEARELIEGFYQHGEGNCVSIATIKASLIEKNSS